MAYGRSLIGTNYHDSPPTHPIRLSEAGSRGRIIILISERIIHIIHIRFSKIFQAEAKRQMPCSCNSSKIPMPCASHH